jgi:hypothetical protein
MKKTIALLPIVVFQLTWGIAQRNQIGSIERFLFPPELVMRNQELLQLTEEQRTSIVREIQQAQSEFTALHWDLQREIEGLASLLRTRELDEPSILDQLDKVLDLEHKVKRMQLILALRIRNHLNDDQFLKLLRLKARLNARRGNREPRRDQP